MSGNKVEPKLIGPVKTEAAAKSKKKPAKPPAGKAAPKRKKS
jgi:hypothetical protein